MKQRPSLGETRTAEQLGLRGRAIRVYAACPNCGIQRWVRQQSAKSLCRVCAANSRENHKITNHASTSWSKGTPQAGDTAIASEIGRKGKGYYTWLLCPDCNNGRWVQNRSYSQSSPCFYCANKRRLLGDKNPRWNNGVRYDPGHGYYVRATPDQPYYEMAIKAGGQKYIAEHRLIMAVHLGRLLEKWEVVHHINGDDTDNRLENLELLPDRTHHLPLNLLQTQLYETQKRVTELEAEVTLLRAQLASMPIPSEAVEQPLNGTCRDLTGGTLDDRVKGKSMLAGNCETNMLSSLTRSSPTSKNGVPDGQPSGKLAANSGKPVEDGFYGNPDLAGDLRLRARVETLHCPPQAGEEKVHSPRKLGGESASPAPIPAALTQWRWVNAPNSGNAKPTSGQANPDLADGESRRARVETLRGALLTRIDEKENEE